MNGVQLRPLADADATVFAAWAVDPVFCAHAGWREVFCAHAGWREAATPREFVPWWRERAQHPDVVLLRLTAPHGGDIVGYIDLHGEGDTTRELGFVVGPSSRWGQGWGRALATACIAYGFRTLRLAEIWAEALAANTGSVKILERLGMTRTGTGADDDFLGVRSTYQQFLVTRRTWLESENRRLGPNRGEGDLGEQQL